MKQLISLFIFLFFCFSLTINAQDINAGRVAFYPFSGNANDALGTNHGTINGASLVSDRFGNANGAFNFDGVDDFIEIAHNDLLNFGVDNDFSISFWVRIATTQANTTGNNDIISKWNANTSSGYPYAIRYYDDNGAKDQFHRKILCQRYDTQTCGHAPRVQSPCALPMEQWLHIVFRKTGEELTMFENGTLVNTGVDATSNSCGVKNVNAIYFGKRGGNQRHFKGAIDDISFYNRAITNEEARIIFEENGWTAPLDDGKNTDLLSFAFPEQTDVATIDNNNHTVNITVKCQADLTKLTADFTLPEGATAEIDNVNQLSGSTVNDFSAPVIYTITGKNTCYQQNWTVNVHLEKLDQNDIELQTAFESFSLPEQVGTTTLDAASHSIDITVKCHADLTVMAANFTLPEGATAQINDVAQTSGSTTNNFSAPVVYTITSKNTCYQQDWTVNVHLESLDQHQINLVTAFESFSFPEQTKAASINFDDYSVRLEVKCNTDLSKLRANFTLPNGVQSVLVNGVKQVSGATENSFERPVVYELSNIEKCAVQQWTIFVSLKQRQLETIVGEVIPNVITPNNDDTNDTWKIVSDIETNNTHVRIFNRWGSLVFEDHNYKNNWGGETLRSSVYYYTITSKCSTSDQYKGWLHVIK